MESRHNHGFYDSRNGTIMVQSRYTNGTIMDSVGPTSSPTSLRTMPCRRYDTLGGGSVSADASSDKAPDVAWRMTIEWGNTMGKMNKSWGIILEISYHITC